MSDLYLDLLEKCLLNIFYEDVPNDPWTSGCYDFKVRANGQDWPSQAHTMIGWHRLRQLREACETVIREGICGDFIETGVWRGGACILMRAVLKVHNVQDRKVWCADSFEGLPKPDAAQYPVDQNDTHHRFSQLAVGIEDVKRNFRKYDLLDEQVVFLKGWFKDTLAAAPITTLAVLRLDGDMYESTMQALDLLYDKVSVGGFVIVDDYLTVPACKAAVIDFRASRMIANELIAIDQGGVFWRKT